MRKPCENPKKTKKNKFCNEMQHKATQEDFPCVPKAAKQCNTRPIRNLWRNTSWLALCCFSLQNLFFCFSLDFHRVFLMVGFGVCFWLFLFLNIIRNSFLLKSKIKMFQWNKTQRKSEKSKEKQQNQRQPLKNKTKKSKQQRFEKKRIPDFPCAVFHRKVFFWFSWKCRMVGFHFFGDEMQHKDNQEFISWHIFIFLF